MKMGSEFRTFTTASRKAFAWTVVMRLVVPSTRRTASTIVPSELDEYFCVKLRESILSFLSGGKARSLKPNGATTLYRHSVAKGVIHQSAVRGLFSSESSALAVCSEGFFSSVLKYCGRRS